MVNMQDFVKVLSAIPIYTSHIYYNKATEGRTPRFDSVFKILKESLKVELGVDYKALSSEQQLEFKKMAEDAYYGLRESQ